MLVASSIIPSGDDPCVPGGTGYVNALNPFTGGSLSVGILDVNNNKNYKDDILSACSSVRSIWAWACRAGQP